MNRRGLLTWLDRPALLVLALALTAAMYVVTVLHGGVGEYIPQPSVLAVVLGALVARWRPGLGWLLAITGMMSTATMLMALAVGSLYPDGTVTIDLRGDLSRVGEFRPTFALQLVAILLATAMATVLAFRVTNRRWVLVAGAVLLLAVSALGAYTLATGDWMTYSLLTALPMEPYAAALPVLTLLVLAGLWWAAGVARRVRQEAGMAPPADRLPVIRSAVLAELVPAFAGAQRSAATVERARLATELHASVLPAIRSVVQTADRSGPASPDLRARLTELETELRRIADGKRNVLLDEFGLVGAIEDLVEGTQQGHGIPIELQVDGDVDLGRPPSQVEQVGFDICRLALDNAVRHAGPTRILVVVGATRASLVIEVTDDGRGIGADDVETARRAGRHGVSDMQKAARSVSGRLVIERAAAGGSHVSFEWGGP